MNANLKKLAVLLVIPVLLSGCADSDSDDSAVEVSDYVWYRLEGTMSWENANSSNLLKGTGTLSADLYFENDPSNDTKKLAYYYIYTNLDSYGGTDGICVASSTTQLPVKINLFPNLDADTIFHSDLNRMQISFDTNQSLTDYQLPAVINCGMGDTSIPDYPFYKLLAGLQTEDLVIDTSSGLGNKKLSYDISDPSGNFYEEMNFTLTYLGETATTENSLNGNIEGLTKPSAVAVE
ncbi:MAG: hypothetical protein WCT46_04090 [Candidatus Gracilibacteria bacterium]|jgi:hypothetical protein